MHHVSSQTDLLDAVPVGIETKDMPTLDVMGWGGGDNLINCTLMLQVLSLSQVSLGQISVGHVINLASNDVQRFDPVSHSSNPPSVEPMGPALYPT